MDAGFDDLIDAARNLEGFPAVAIAAGGTRPEHLPWLVRSGITRVHLGASVRPGGSWTKAYVDAGFVRSWRLLLDSALGGLAQGAGQAG
jgi:copper homeostasis protein